MNLKNHYMLLKIRSLLKLLKIRIYITLIRIQSVGYFATFNFRSLSIKLLGSTSWVYSPDRVQRYVRVIVIQVYICNLLIKKIKM